MTPGREVYERWLRAQDISPDDLWDYLDPHERIGWESLAAVGGGPEQEEGWLDGREQRIREIKEAMAKAAEPGEDLDGMAVHVELLLTRWRREDTALAVPGGSPEQDMEKLAALPTEICGMVCSAGPNLAPLACAWKKGHRGPHSWSTLPTFEQDVEGRRWTLINESDYDFAFLAYDGPPVKAGERVEVVEVGGAASQGQLTDEQWKLVGAALRAWGVPELAVRLRSLAGGEEGERC